MNEVPLAFWSGWTIGIVAIGIGFLAWLALGVFTAKKGSINPPDQVWDDDLREGNDEPPKWWFFALFGTLIFSATYIMLYPGLGLLPGLLNWTQHSQFKQGLAHYQEKTGGVHDKWTIAPLDELRQDRSAMESARRIYMVHCASCHGEDARGQAGMFPSLADEEWHWGGSDEELLNTLNNGRVAAMPGWQQLGDEQVEAVTDYVIALSRGEAVDGSDLEAGRLAYSANCVACHGANGEGNPALGSPRLNEGHVWQYLPPGGDLRTAVLETIRHGRQGIMPAQAGRLRKEQIRVLAAWLVGGKGIAPPEGMDARAQ